MVLAAPFKACAALAVLLLLSSADAAAQDAATSSTSPRPCLMNPSMVSRKSTTVLSSRKRSSSKVGTGGSGGGAGGGGGGGRAGATLVGGEGGRVDAAAPPPPPPPRQFPIKPNNPVVVSDKGVMIRVGRDGEVDLLAGFRGLRISSFFKRTYFLSSYNNRKFLCVSLLCLLALPACSALPLHASLASMPKAYTLVVAEWSLMEPVWECSPEQPR